MKPINSLRRTLGLTTEWAPSWWPPRLWKLWFWHMACDVQHEFQETRNTLEASRNVIRRMKAEK